MPTREHVCTIRNAVPRNTSIRLLGIELDDDVEVAGAEGGDGACPSNTHPRPRRRTRQDNLRLAGVHARRAQLP